MKAWKSITTVKDTVEKTTCEWPCQEHARNKLVKTKRSYRQKSRNWDKLHVETPKRNYFKFLLAFLFSLFSFSLLSSRVDADWWSDRRDEVKGQLGALDPTVEENWKRWQKAVEEILSEPCAEPFKTYVSSINLTCMADSGFQDWTENLKEAKRILVREGFFSDQDFEGVTFAWCEALGDFAAGLTPMPNRILLNRDYRHESGQFLAPLVGHEMVHVRQMRGMGMNPFACQYSAELIKGHGQECLNTFEAEAYRLEVQVDWALPSIKYSELRLCGLVPPPGENDFPESGNATGVGQDLPEGGIPAGVWQYKRKEAVLMLLNQYMMGGF